MCYEDNAGVEEEAGCSMDLMKKAGRVGLIIGNENTKKNIKCRPSAVAS